MLVHKIAAASTLVRETRARTKKIAAIGDLIGQATDDELPIVVELIAGRPRQGKIGIGASFAHEVRQASTPSDSPSLTVIGLDSRLAELAGVSGKGAATRRRSLLGRLLNLATAPEQDFITRTLIGEVRQGALEAVVLEAISVTTKTRPALVRRAMMLSGSLGPVAAAARRGEGALTEFSLEVFRPLLPMLAQPAAGLQAALAELGNTSLEYKLDGARVQIHKQGDRVEVYTRKLNVVTPAVPEIVEATAALPCHTGIFDGEAIVLREDGAPQPFQTTMRRFGRRLNVEKVRRELPLSVRVFDCLRLDETTLLDEPAHRRWDALAEAAPPELLIPRTVVTDPRSAENFMGQALADGHEGVMAKSMDAAYEAGKRGKGWRKLKTAHTLDLVVLAAEWGSGRRQGRLSNLHLGARVPSDGSFVMLGKTFKGLTDALLEWQTRELLAREIGRDGHVVHVRPELVVEIAFNDVQASTQYPGGMALRFARVKQYRKDKPANEADTLDRIREIFSATAGS